MMKHKIQAAFDQVTAESTLKENTAAYVLQHMAPKRAPYRPPLAAVACLVLVIAGGFWSIFTPTAEISIDINPSVVLEVNRFDRVISLDSYNADGADLVRTLDVKFLNYADAVEKIMASDQVSALLSQDELMTIAVTGQNARQSEAICSQLQTSASVYCYHAESEEAAQAHHMGLSHPRYQAYLTLQEQGTPVDAEDLNNMSMKEIHDLVNGHHEEAHHETQETQPSNQNGHNNGEHHDADTGNGHQYGQSSTQETTSGNGNHHSTNGHHQNQHGNGHS